MAALMAVKEILVDDINGDEHATTVPFSVRDKHYEIDLGKKGEKAFEDALRQFIGVARVVNGGNAVAAKKSAGGVKSKRRSPSRRRAGSKPAVSKHQGSDADELRAWAKANGHNVAERGRISADVRQAFEKSKAEAKAADVKPPVVEPHVNGSQMAAV